MTIRKLTTAYAVKTAIALALLPGAAYAQGYRTPGPNESFLHANPNALSDLLGGMLTAQTDAMRSLDASCKDLGVAKQKEWGMFNQCQENHAQLVEKGLAR